MMKKMMGLAVLSGVLGGTVLAMAPKAIEQPEPSKVQAAIDTRLHELLVQMRERRELR